jgi:hypothetical protein
MAKKILSAIETVLPSVLGKLIINFAISPFEAAYYMLASLPPGGTSIRTKIETDRSYSDDCPDERAWLYVMPRDLNRFTPCDEDAHSARVVRLILEPEIQPEKFKGLNITIDDLLRILCPTVLNMDDDDLLILLDAQVSPKHPELQCKIVHRLRSLLDASLSCK